MFETQRCPLRLGFSTTKWPFHLLPNILMLPFVLLSLARGIKLKRCGLGMHSLVRLFWIDAAATKILRGLNIF